MTTHTPTTTLSCEELLDIEKQKTTADPHSHCPDCDEDLYFWLWIGTLLALLLALLSLACIGCYNVWCPPVEPCCNHCGKNSCNGACQDPVPCRTCGNRSCEGGCAPKTVNVSQPPVYKLVASPASTPTMHVPADPYANLTPVIGSGIGTDQSVVLRPRPGSPHWAPEDSPRTLVLVQKSPKGNRVSPMPPAGGYGGDNGGYGDPVPNDRSYGKSPSGGYGGDTGGYGGDNGTYSGNDDNDPSCKAL